MRSRVLLVATTVVLASGATVAAVRRATAANHDTERSAPITTVGVRQIGLRTVATGSIRLAPGARIDVGARASGVVRRLLVTQGARPSAVTMSGGSGPHIQACHSRPRS
ncbi:MAG TPA: hypothetical protein VNW46_15550, partial [Gemmatimonadaceae bacterium]|nr:hypothetical protein [Gemmatimonadaceae bacterium]